ARVLRADEGKRSASRYAPSAGRRCREGLRSRRLDIFAFRVAPGRIKRPGPQKRKMTRSSLQLELAPLGVSKWIKSHIKITRTSANNLHGPGKPNLQELTTATRGIGWRCFVTSFG